MAPTRPATAKTLYVTHSTDTANGIGLYTDTDTSRIGSTFHVKQLSL